MSCSDENARPLETLEREISASPQEYCRGVRLAFPGQVAEHGTTLRVEDGKATMEIVLTAVAPRALGALALPALKVTIRFSGGTRQQRQALLARMDMATQRGGG